MNQHRYRLIFNKTRGLLMAVAETAASQGKASGETRGAAAGGGVSLIATVKPLAFVFWSLLGLVSLAQAQIVADPTAPGKQRPTILNAANGVPLVNIQTPSAAGVSRNTYRQFDVQQRGAILNNSRTNTQTQLGGWVQGNPWLAAGSARVILNEVNSNNPSLLNGYVEVAGARAQIVIANPAGISCDGCGFINANRATLTTGTPIVNDGRLDGYRIDGGAIVIGGRGMDASGTDYADLLTRAVQINAGIWAKQLDIVTGANRIGVDPASGEAGISQTLAGSSPAPAFAIDTALVGGMYAGKINIVATEAGVGVRNAGQLYADAGTIRITSAGHLENTGQINAKGDARLDAQTGVHNAGVVYAQGNVALSTRGDIGNSGLIAAQGNTLLAATGAGSRIDSTSGAVLAAGVQSDGTLGNAGSLTVAATQTVAARGQNLSGGEQSLTARAVDLSGSQTSAGKLAIVASAGDIDLADATVAVGQTFAAAARETLRTDRAALSAERIDFDAGALSNVQGQIAQTGRGPMNITVDGQLDNTGGVIVSHGNATLAVGTLANQGGTLLVAGPLPTALTLTAAGGIDNSQGDIAASGDLSVAAARLDNAQGRITAEQALAVTTAQATDNAQGVLAANGPIALDASRIDNSAGFIGSAQDAVSLAARTDALDNTAGRIEAARAIAVSARGIDNGEGTVIGGSLAADSRGEAFDNTGGILATSTGKLDLQSGAFTNDGGLIQSASALTIDTHGGRFANSHAGGAGGLVAAQGSVRLDTDTGEIDNTGGTLAASGGLTLRGGAVTNTDGLIASDASATLEAGALDNRGGEIQAGGNVAITLLGTLDNHHSLVRAGQNLSIHAAHIINSQTQDDNQGLEGNDITLTAARIDNDHGAIRADGDATLNSGGHVDNAAGLISAGNTLALQDLAAHKTLAIANSGGTLIAGRQLSVASADLGGDGNLLSLGGIDIELRQSLDNSGQITANGGIRIQTAADLSNQGKLASGGALAVQAQTLANQATGTIEGGQVSLQAATALTNRGLINGGETLLQAPSVANLGTGRIYGDHLGIAAQTLVNAPEGGTAPVIAARDRLDLGVHTLDNREHALIFSAGDMAIGGALDDARRATGQAHTLTNASATIEALGDLSLSAGVIHNHNLHFSTRVDTVSSEQIVEYQGSGSPNRYLDGTPNVYTFENESLRLHTPEGDYTTWSLFNYTRTVTETRIAESDPGQILAGGTMRIAAGTLDNDKSWIIAGGDLLADLVTLNNTEVSGERTLTDAGTVTSYSRKKRKGRDTTRSSTAAYAPAASVQSISLTPTLYRQHAAVAGSGTQVAALAGVSLGQTPDAAGQVAGTTAAGQVIAPIHAVVATGDPATLIKSGGVNTGLPNNSLYRVVPGSSAHYLVESDPAFAHYRTWLSSDYLLAALALDPALMQKRLGDGFYEQKLIRDQVAQLTGRRFLEGYADDEAQYAALMDAGVTVAEVFGLIPGVALSATQMAALTSDIVWLVEQSVTLPDGTTQRALVPQLYVRVGEGDLTPGGALIAGNDLQFRLSGDLVNSGAIAGRQVVSINAANVANLQGRIQGNTVALDARQDIAVLGGEIVARDALIALAGRDLTVASTTRTQTGSQGSRTNIERIAGLYVTGEGGRLLASAGGDLTLNAAQIVTAGDTALLAGHDLNLGTVTERYNNRVVWNSNNWRSDASHAEVGTHIQSQGDLILQAGKDINARGASASSGGAITLSAGNDVNLTAGSATIQLDEAHKFKGSSSAFSSTTTTTRDSLAQSVSQASTLSGDTVTVLAGRDIKVVGSNVVSDHGTLLAAQNDLTIESAVDTHQETHFKATKKSGLFSGGGIGFTIGTQQQSVDQQGVGTTAAASTIGSIAGDVILLAGNAYTQTGSDVIALQGDVDISAKSVTLQEARETRHDTVETKFKQSGLTVALTSPVISAIQTAEQLSKAAKHTDDGRMKALATGATALSGYNAYNAVQAGQGSTINGKDNQIVVTDKGQPVWQKDSAGNVLKDASGNPIPETRDANMADKVGGINVSISIGSSKSSSKSEQDSDTAKGSSVMAGNDIKITASGGGKDSNITLQGSDVTAGNDVSLSAENAINLLAAQNTASQHSTNKSSNASVGIGFSLGGQSNGFTLNIGVSGARGNADGDDLAWSNSHVTAGNRVDLQSGGDTRLIGASVSAPQVISEIGGDLLIQSLQDSSTFASKQKSVGGSLSLCIPPFCYGASSGSVSFSKSKVASDYASVGEQSGIRAGDGGFQVDVKGNTALKGGAITSTQEAIDQNRNRFETGGELTLSDIENKASYDADAVGVNVGTSVNFSGGFTPQGSGAGVGSDGDSASSTTLAAISGIAGNTEARTGDRETGIGRIFDADKVQKEIDAQVQITQAFNEHAPKAAATYATNQIADLKRQAELETDPVRKAELLDEASKWGVNGSYAVAMNIIIGAVGGNLESAITKEALSWAANEMRQAMIEDSKKFKGLCDTQGNCISNISGESVGVNGDNLKIAGGRIVLSDWCAEGRCEKAPDDAPTKTGYKENPDGTVIFTPKDQDGSAITLGEFIGLHQDWRSPMGGHQGEKGQMVIAGFKIEYEKGSFLDQLAEAYSGTHDILNSPIWYDELGNGKNLNGTALGKVGDVLNITNVGLATPFAIGVLLPPEVWNSIVTGINFIK